MSEAKSPFSAICLLLVVHYSFPQKRTQRIIITIITTMLGKAKFAASGMLVTSKFVRNLEQIILRSKEYLFQNFGKTV